MQPSCQHPTTCTKEVTAKTVELLVEVVQKSLSSGSVPTGLQNCKYDSPVQENRKH